VSYAEIRWQGDPIELAALFEQAYVEPHSGSEDHPEFSTARDIDRMRERYDARMIDRHLDTLDRHEAENSAAGPQAPDCDEPDACTCSRNCGACERPDGWEAE
jgi:hypothetical protein